MQNVFQIIFWNVQEHLNKKQENFPLNNVYIREFYKYVLFASSSVNIKNHIKRFTNQK